MEPQTNAVITSQERFKSRNPNYFKNYYKNNKHRYKNKNKNKTFKSNKKKWYGVEIFGTVYVFDHKSDIKIKNIDKQTLSNPNIIRVKS